MLLRISFFGRLGAAGLAISLSVAALALTEAPARAAASHAPIEGSGSSWAGNAVDQWVADVASSGLHVDFTNSGSAIGRKDFANGTTDFAVSDIGFLGTDPATGESDTSQGRAFAYLPIVAGGTAFPYQIRVAGKLVRSLRLSGSTLAKIFTNQITNWNDPAITADNNGHPLPSLTIIPLVHSEGSGSSYQFTRYLAKVYPSIWSNYAGNPNPTEYYPMHSGSQMIAQNGSDGVMNFLTSSAGNGAIAYDEYSYAKNKNYPVARIENTAGYYTLPTQYNVAVALTQAEINYDKSSPDYLLQDLDKVYTYGDSRTYPMSSYSYMIIPTAPDDQRMGSGPAKRQTIVDFVSHAICEGQGEIGPIGYSPMPVNLVQRAFGQVALLKQANSDVTLQDRDVTTCHNPTFVAGHPEQNYLAKIAPAPPACDKSGNDPCQADEDLVNGNPVNGHATVSAGAGPGRPLPATRVGQAPPSTTVGSGPTAAAAAGGPAPVDSSVLDPTTGAPVVAGQQQAAASADLIGTPTVLPVSGAAGTGVLAALVAAELLLILVAPPILARALARRRPPTS